MITIFTPTYNRAYILPKLYKSLEGQFSVNFEWLIVDDGSTDNTEELVKQWQKEQNRFSIHYIKQENAGKHTAINKGVKEAKGEAFFIVDSDDKLPADAIATIEQEFAVIAKDRNYAGIAGLKGNINNAKPLGNSKQMPQLNCSMIDIRQKYGIRGDMAEVFKTEILKKYPFPVFEGENFIDESAVWNKIAEKYILRYIPKVWYLCEYLPDGLTSNIRKKYRDNPQGTVCWLKSILNSPMFSFKRKLWAAALYWRYLCMRKIGYTKSINWTYLLWPIGVVAYFYDRIKGR